MLWLAHSEELCEQAASEFEDAWSSLGDREVTVHRFWGDAELDAEELDDGFIVAGLGKLYNKAKKDSRSILAMRRQVSLVVMDEAHPELAPTYNFLLDFFTVAPRPRCSTCLLRQSRIPPLTKTRRLRRSLRTTKCLSRSMATTTPLRTLSTRIPAKTAFEQIEYSASEELSEGADPAIGKPRNPGSNPQAACSR